MNKKRAKINFIFATLLLIVALFFCFAQFKMPFSNNDFYGLFNSISATNDISYGNSAVYEITSEKIIDREVNETVSQIRDILDNQGFAGSKVFRQDNYIRVEVQSISNASTILSIIGDSKSFYISSIDKETITKEELNSYDIVGTDICNAYSTTQVNLDQEYNGVTIEFNANGKEKLKELYEHVNATENKTIYFYIDGQKSTSLKIEENQSDKISFYFNADAATSDDAKEYALQILMSSTGVELKTISNSTTTPLFGKDVLVYTMIACAAIILAILVILPIIFGDFGFVADLSIISGIVLNIFLLQALPLTTSSFAGIIATMISVGLMTVCHVLYLNKIKSEFKTLKRLQLAVRTGFKKSWLTNLDLCVITFLGAIMLCFWNIPFVSTLGISLAVGSFVALFNTVIVAKDFVTWYVWINPKNYKRVKFTKEEGNEI